MSSFTRGGITTTDTSCDSVVTSGLQRLATPQHPPHDATHSSIISLAEETLTEFLAKATGTAVDWIPLCGMKPGSESTGMVNISHLCTGVAARACGLVGLEPARVVGILKDRPSWHRDCRRLSTLCATSTGNGGTIEVLYMQMYAPTTLAPPRDFCTLRYTTPLEDGSYVMCERSLNGIHGVPTTPPMVSFVRADMLSSGALIRPCEGSASFVILVDHMDMEPWTVPEVLRPLYESSAVLANRMSVAALRHLRVVAQESVAIIDAPRGAAVQQPAQVRSLSQRLCRGFNDAVNGFTDDGWTTIGSDGLDDITIVVKPNFKELGSLQSAGVLCAKGSMLLQNVPPAPIVRFLREHRAEWADYKVAALRISGSGAPHADFSSSQTLYRETEIIEQDEFLELLKLEDDGLQRGESLVPRETLLLQHCSGLEENAAGACAQMVFAPIDANISEEDLPFLPSGFRVIRLDRAVQDGNAPSRTLDLASTLEVGPAYSRLAIDNTTVHVRSVLTIAFQFPYESHLQEGVASVARQFVRKVVSTVQRVAIALAPARINSLMGPTDHLPGSPEELTLARSMCRSYKRNVGMDLLLVEGDSTDEYLKRLWHHYDAIMCCSCKNLPMFTFANQAGLDMLETTSAALHELSCEKTVDEEGKKDLCSILHQVLQQGYACFPAGIRLSSKGRPASYDRAVAWKVLDDEDSVHGVAFAYTNWSFI